MNKKFNYKNLKWLWLSIFLMLLDIGIKYWVKTRFLLGEVCLVLPGINCYYIRNYGLAFGLFAHASTYCLKIFIWITILIIIVFIVNLCTLFKCPRYCSMAYSMVIGGALGNLLDRILYGSVVDFIDIYIKSWHWPTFNVADIVICMGIAVLLVKYCCDLFRTI